MNRSAYALSTLLLPLCLATAFAAPPTSPPAAPPLPTGASVTPAGVHTGVGSFPVAMALSPDGRYAVVSNIGARQYLSVIDARTGRLVSQKDFNAPRTATDRARQALFMGLAFAPAAPGGEATLYASRGTEDFVSAFTLSPDGTLNDTGRKLTDSAEPGKSALCPSGLGVSADGGIVYAANNITSRDTDFKGSLALLDTATGTRRALITVPGYPLAVAVVTRGPAAHRKVYVTSERDGVVADVDPQGSKVRRSVRTGDHPTALLLDRSQRRLFVANAGSDTVSVVSPGTDRVLSTVLLRPVEARGLPGCSPIGLALDPTERRLYVALADMNAIAVLDATPVQPKLLGYIPTGWYPTSVLVAPDGKSLLVACAKGLKPRVPNHVPQGPGGAWGQYDLAILEGVVSRIAVPDAKTLAAMTARVLQNNRVPRLTKQNNPVAGLPIKHVMYIIKENRTYDQVLGDMKRGNSDTAALLFGRQVTPNQHALADRFVLLDNFYCSAEVSGTGWNWSTAGMANPYTERTVAYNYSGRGRTYDWEGTNAGQPVDLLGLPDVARAPGGYIWENTIRHGVSTRNYGCFTGRGARTPQGTEGFDPANQPLKRILEGRTDPNFRQFDLSYADSDAWVKINAPDTVRTKAYGRYNAPSRYSAWKREFDQFVRNGKLPRFSIIRLGRDHTSGTNPGAAAPSAMVADNDYAVGEIVEAVSKSPYWKSTAIFVIEDDAQDGHDHVDCHRSVCFVISPYVRKSMLDSRFYNTDSVLHTMEAILGIPPMNRYDATAPIFDIWTKTPANAAPYTAILPDPAILRQVNKATAYRAKDSVRLPFHIADAVPEPVLNDILWHAVRGAHTPEPPIHGSLYQPDRDDD